MKKQWSFEEAARAVKAAELYERQWAVIKDLEFPDDDDVTPPSLRQKVDFELDKGPAERLNPDDYEFSLLIEDEPETVADHIRSRPGRSYLPEYLLEVLDVSEIQEEPDEDIPLTENADIRINESGLDYFYIPAGSMAPDGEETDEGQFVWRINGQFYHVPRSVWDDICADYSEMGGDLTRKEIARKYGIRFSIIKVMLRKAGQFKASLPFSERAVLEAETPEEIETLEDKAIEVKERYLENRIKRKLRRRQKRRLMELEKEERTRQRFLAQLSEIASDISIPGIPEDISAVESQEGENFTAHLPTTDEHIGLEAWHEETFGGNFDSDIGCNRLKALADYQAQWLLSQPGHCKRVYRTFVGDLVHALTGETEHGTDLDQDTRSAKVWRMLIETLVYCINVLRAASSRVVVLGARGNHDGEVSFFQAMYTLKVIFESAGIDDVEIRATPQRFSYFREGDTLHILDHGYYMNKLTGWKAKAQAQGTARVVGGDAFHGARFITSYYGHKHERESSMANADHELRRLPALCETDDYSTELRYHSHAVADLFRLDEQGRIGRSITRVWLDELDTDKEYEEYVIERIRQ